VFDKAYRERILHERGSFARLVYHAGSWVFRKIDRVAWKKYARIVCISREAHNRASAGGLLPGENKIEILYPAPGFQVERPSEQFDRYFFLPGRIMWTKNLELGIAAFREFKAGNVEFEDFRLVIAGIVDKKSESYYARLRKFAAGEPHIEFRMMPSDAELADLYRNCYGVLFTAFNEDWGIVPLESMTFGKPVIAVNRGGPRESIQTGVQGYLEEPEPAAFAKRMAEMASDPALTRRLGRAGFERAKRYTWQSFADRMDDEIDRVCGTSQNRNCAAPAKAVETVS